jgi:hypothetical protein
MREANQMGKIRHNSLKFNIRFGTVMLGKVGLGPVW